MRIKNAFKKEFKKSWRWRWTKCILCQDLVMFEKMMYSTHEGKIKYLCIDCQERVEKEQSKRREWRQFQSMSVVFYDYE